MPNHIRNVVKMKGIANLPLYTEEKDLMSGEMMWDFDFNKIIPMPEDLDLTESSIFDLAIEAVVRKLNAAKRPYSRQITVADMNDESYCDSLTNCRETEDELLELGLKYITNVIRFGAATWYDWCQKNWGTKWSAYETRLFDADTLTFTSANTPPEPVLARLSKMYPDVEIEHWWASVSCGENTGYAKYSGGKLVESVSYDDYSPDACDTYVICWGETECFYQDEAGHWNCRDCTDFNRC